jgi:hypothetical protein
MTGNMEIEQENREGVKVADAAILSASAVDGIGPIGVYLRHNVSRSRAKRKDPRQ